MKAYNTPKDELLIKSDEGEELVKITSNETTIKNMDLSSLGVESTPEEIDAAADYVGDLNVTAEKVNTAASTIDQAYRVGEGFVAYVPSANVYPEIVTIDFSNETYAEYEEGNTQLQLIPKEGSATIPTYLNKVNRLTMILSNAITQSLFSSGTATASLFDVGGVDDAISLYNRELTLEFINIFIPLHFMGAGLNGYIFQGGIYISNAGATIPDGYYYFEVIFSNNSPSSNTTVIFNLHYFSPDSIT